LPTAQSSDPGTRTLLALGVARDRRRAGIARRLLAAHLDDAGERTAWEAMVGAGERDVADPLDAALRFRVALDLLEGAGFEVRRMEASGGGGAILALLATRA
jgi:GNAT superfamily N-acetyltransferase